MESLVHHLRQLIKINRQILNQLNKDEASVDYMNEAFSQREIHTHKITEIVPGIDKEKLSEEQSDLLKALFKRFNQQSNKIQEALDTIIHLSQERLTDATRRRKAEEGYQILKKPNISYF